MLKGSYWTHYDVELYIAVEFQLQSRIKNKPDIPYNFLFSKHFEAFPSTSPKEKKIFVILKS